MAYSGSDAYYKSVHRNYKSLLLLCCFLVGCGGPGDRIRERANALASPTPTPGERQISGLFEVDGTGPGGLEPYKGTLTIEPQGELYTFRWQLPAGNRVGTGVQYDDKVAVSFAPAGGGKGCGVTIYKIGPGGAAMSGRSANFGDQKFAIENATRGEGTSFEGKYSVTGTTEDGKPYSGTLETKKDGEGHDFLWKTDKPLAGFGTWRGSYAAVGFGGTQCSFALYDISGNTLDGYWGGQKQIMLGKETAKR